VDTPEFIHGEERLLKYLKHTKACTILVSMKLTAPVKLKPTPEQRQLLYETLQMANAACNAISDMMWDEKVWSQYNVHKLVYYDIRDQFDLAAQIVIRCISKVVDAYKIDRKTRRQFKKHGAVSYDSRVLNWRIPDHNVSIWLLGGRQEIGFATGDHQLALLPYQQGESDLVYKKGEFYLFATCDVPDEAPFDPDGFLGVDLGIANIATDSDGEMYSGSEINNVRHRRRRLRRKLQKKSTLGTHRRLKKLAGREQRFARHINHTISKRIVTKAQGTGQGIALEDLGGIRDRVTVRKSQRATLHGWSFYQLRQFIDYKAQLRGVPVVYVDPRNTSRECSVCGCVDKRNRPSQATFSCTSCGHAAHADVNAAINISRRAAVNPPYCSDATSVAAPEQSPCL
jgi:putative transposase